MRKVLYVPLDDRDCNYQFPWLLSQMTEGLELLRPPYEWMGFLKKPADREKMILYELFFYLRAFCEVERYGTFLRVTESIGNSGMIDYCLRRLEKLPMHKYNNREEKLTYETHNNKP